MKLASARAAAIVMLALAPRAAAQERPATATLTGIVVDARDGNPIRDVSVRLQGGTTTVTGDDGRFAIEGVPAGRQELYVSVVDFMLVKRTVSIPQSGVLDLTIPIAPGTGTYTENITVRPATVFTPATSAVAEQTLPSTELQQLRGLITNDPFRAVQVLPGVAAGDDLRSEFTVRGNAVDHMNFTFEGVPAPFLVHTVQGIHDSGSIAMVNGDVLDDIVLATGSYPQHYGGRTGAELDFHLRDGSRDGTRSHVSLSFTDAAFVFEGPLPGRKGSWLTSVRKSYLDRLIKRLDPANDFAFGFTDLQTKLIHEPTNRQQLQFAVTAGRSRLDRRLDEPDPDRIADGRNSTAIGVLTWRYAASSRFVITQKLSGTVNQFRNRSNTLEELDRGRASEALYRLDWTYALSPRLVLDGGGQTGRSASTKRSRQRRTATEWHIVENFSATAWSESAYGEARLTTGRGTITGGARLDHWGLTGDAKASPWAQAAWNAGPVILRVGGGLYRQPPGFLETVGLRGTAALLPEHAAQFDAAVEGRVNRLTRWQVAVYNREDRDLIKLPGFEFKVDNSRLIFPSTASRYANALDGHSRGIELLLQRRSVNGLSGWAAYSFGSTRYHDRSTSETFWGDWDQRHTVNAYGSYRFNAKFSASSRFRYGSNFPATGYWESRGTQYFVGTARNELRVAPYSRLDTRVNRAFAWSEKRLTLYVEVINVYARRNVRFASGGINGRTFEVFGLFDKMFPRIPSVGFLLEL